MNRNFPLVIFLTIIIFISQLSNSLAFYYKEYTINGQIDFKNIKQKIKKSNIKIILSHKMGIGRMTYADKEISGKSTSNQLVDFSVGPITENNIIFEHSVRANVLVKIIDSDGKVSYFEGEKDFDLEHGEYDKDIGIIPLELYQSR